MTVKERKYQKGITLIALVITIIVLLILAGVTINIIINQGIIDKTQTVIDEYKVSEYKERIELIKTGEQFKKLSNESKDSLKKLVVEKLKERENENWVKEVKTSEDDILEENQIKVITQDKYIIVAEIEEDGKITYITIERDNGEPYPSLEVEVLPLEGKENEKVKIRVKAEVEKTKNTKKIAKIELILGDTVIDTRLCNDSTVEDIFEVEENGEYRIKATTDQGKSTSKRAKVNIEVTYIITYNANGGTGEPASQTKTYGVDLTLSSTEPTYTNATFLGWAENNGATNATYRPGGTYTANKSVTLYAVWKIKNIAPIISSTSVYARNTNYITIRAMATDADADTLTYKLYLKTSTGTYPTTPNVTSSATASGTNVDLKATGLSTYTVYNYKVEVTDGKSVVTSTEGTTGTGCDGTGLICGGIEAKGIYCRTVRQTKFKF